MKDLDFDELDKAVNSLMASGQKESESTPISSPAVSSPASSASVVPVSVPSSPRQAPPATRRAGRFMDVVHPGAKKEGSPQVSRQAPTLQPVTSLAANTPVQPKPKEEAADSLPLSPVETSNTSPTTDWPDPLEMATAKRPADESAKSDVLAPLAPDGVMEPDVASPQDSSDELPLSSPFLPDAKVEKRPLGGAVLAEENVNALMVEDERAQLPALPKDVEPALPEELHGDVMSIEADNSTTDPSRHLPDSKAPLTPSPVKKDLVTLKTEPPKPVVAVAEAPAPSGPTSISQQYKEEPSSGDQHSGAIYDTDSYHQPLSHPSKKKSGWSWVIWIILILLVGAGGGAALYLLGIVK